MMIYIKWVMKDWSLAGSADWTSLAVAHPPLDAHPVEQMLALQPYHFLLSEGLEAHCAHVVAVLDKGLGEDAPPFLLCVVVGLDYILDLDQNGSHDSLASLGHSRLS